VAKRENDTEQLTLTFTRRDVRTLVALAGRELSYVTRAGATARFEGQRRRAEELHRRERDVRQLLDRLLALAPERADESGTKFSDGEREPWEQFADERATNGGGGE
jgi:hypothetical protein